MLSRLLEATTNVVVIVVALVVGGATVKNYFTSDVPKTSAAKLVGRHLENAYQWKAHPATLLLALRKDCRYCEASMPFYRRINDLRTTNQLKVHLVAVFPDDGTSVRAFLHGYDLTVESISGMTLSRLGVSGTPTLLLVDQTGTVVGAWVGQLSEDGEAEVISKIKKSS